ncbi:MAG: DUF2252 domain-containing protein [Chloroflexi bacterium]|jgi:uncharacterized protein (DUF2252 family)|nr:DUF2252 domain-containing protein [Chloroflexota bacterium]
MIHADAARGADDDAGGRVVPGEREPGTDDRTAPSGIAGYLTVAERIALGRARRDRLSRPKQGDWSPATDRTDPVTILQHQAKHRIPDLVPLRYGRMAASPFAFFRGAAAIMAADLAATPDTGIRVQLCGDAHLMNFGGYAAADRHLVFDVNDFDETLRGPWEWDVKRLAASVAIATREVGGKAGDARRATAAAARGYREKIRELAEVTDLDVWYSRIDVENLAASIPPGAIHDTVEAVIEEARTRDHFRSLDRLTAVIDGRRRFVDEPPVIVHVPDVTTPAWIEYVDARYRRSLRDDRRELFDRYRLVDIAHKVVGVGSVGLAAFVALYEGRDENDPLFLQVKEARESALEQHLPKSRHQNHAHRVVAGQRLMQATSDIFLGWAIGRSGRHYYVRQLADMKWSYDLGNATPDGLSLYVRLCGGALARAHARSGDRIAIAAYLGGSGRFVEAMADFGEAYAEQNLADYRAFLDAIEKGRIPSRSV